MHGTLEPKYGELEEDEEEKETSALLEDNMTKLPFLENNNNGNVPKP